MIAGKACSGKTTFIQAFLSENYEFDQIIHSPNSSIKQYICNLIKLIKIYCFFKIAQRKDERINLKLNFIDTPGYSSIEDYEKTFKSIKHFILEKVKIK